MVLFVLCFLQRRLRLLRFRGIFVRSRDNLLGCRRALQLVEMRFQHGIAGKTPGYSHDQDDKKDAWNSRNMLGLYTRALHVLAATPAGKPVIPMWGATVRTSDRNVKPVYCHR